MLILFYQLLPCSQIAINSPEEKNVSLNLVKNYYFIPYFNYLIVYSELTVSLLSRIIIPVFPGSVCHINILHAKIKLMNHIYSLTITTAFVYRICDTN